MSFIYRVVIMIRFVTVSLASLYCKAAHTGKLITCMHVSAVRRWRAGLRPHPRRRLLILNCNYNLLLCLCAAFVAADAILSTLDNSSVSIGIVCKLHIILD